VRHSPTAQAKAVAQAPEVLDREFTGNMPELAGSGVELRDTSEKILYTLALRKFRLFAFSGSRKLKEDGHFE
jgi:hypothetical protein